MSDQRGWCYWDESVNAYIYRASSLGSCIRSLVASRLGESSSGPNAGLRAAMEASSGLEDEIIRRFSIEMADSSVIWQQKEVELLLKWVNTPGFPKPGSPTKVLVGGFKVAGDPDIIIRGHLDGLYQLDDSVIEVKAFGDANWAKWMSGNNVHESLAALGTLGDKYRIQAAIYGHVTERKVRFVIGHKVQDLKRTGPDGDEVAVWDIDDVDIGPPVDAADLYSLSDLHARIQFIEEHAARDELPPCDSNCREGDPYSEAHLFTGPTTADGILDQLIRDYADLKSKEDDIKELKDIIRERIISEFGVGKYVAGPFTARVEHVKPTQRIDGKKVRKLYPDVFEECSTFGAPTIRLTVTGGDKRDATS